MLYSLSPKGSWIATCSSGLTVAVVAAPLCWRGSRSLPHATHSFAECSGGPCVGQNDGQARALTSLASSPWRLLGLALGVSRGGLMLLLAVASMVIHMGWKVALAACGTAGFLAPYFPLCTRVRGARTWVCSWRVFDRLRRLLFALCGHF